MKCEHEYLKLRYDDAYYCNGCKVTILQPNHLKLYHEILNLITDQYAKGKISKREVDKIFNSSIELRPQEGL